jgi:hypothetical protein
VEAAEVRPVADKHAPVGIAAGGESPGLNIQGRQLLLKFQARGYRATFPVQMRPK